MKRCVTFVVVEVLLLAAGTQANAVMFGPGPHWVDTVLQGEHTFPSKGVFDLQIIGGPFIPGVTLYGPTTVWNSDAYDTSDPLDPDHLNYIDTEMVSMNLTGYGPWAGIQVTAGDGIGNGSSDSWYYSPGWIEEIVVDPYDEAESFFDVNFTITLPPEVPMIGGMTLHNPNPHQMRATITEVPPQVFVYISQGQTELWEDGGSGPVAIITTATHSPEPGSLVLLAFGGVCLIGYAWRRRRR